MTAHGPLDDEPADADGRHHYAHNSVLAELRTVFGERYGAPLVAPAGSIVVAVLSPQPDDQRLADEIAARWHLPGHVQIVEFEPDWIDAWERVRTAVADLAHTEPRPFHSWSTGHERRRPPFRIELAAHAETVAASLWKRFGPLVELRVGLLDYPLRPGQVRRPPASDTEAQPLDPAHFSVTVDGTRTVRSGHTLRCRLLLTNHTDQTVELTSGDALDADVRDPIGGRAVGGYDGIVLLVLRTYRVAPGATTEIPLRVGTASYEADLGCAVPPGDWTISPTLHLGDGRTLVTPPATITIT